MIKQRCQSMFDGMQCTLQHDHAPPCLCDGWVWMPGDVVAHRQVYNGPLAKLIDKVALERQVHAAGAQLRAELELWDLGPWPEPERCGPREASLLDYLRWTD